MFEAAVKEEASGPLLCPYCGKKISNVCDIELNEKYRCSNCKKNFFVVKIPRDIYISFS